MAMTDTLFAFIQFVMVLSVWSYLYKENIFSRVATSIVISISTIHFFLWNVQRAYDMTVIPLSRGRYLILVPVILGALLYTRLSKKYAWIASYAYSVQLGLGTGATLTTLIAGSVIGLISSTVLEPFKYATTIERVSGFILFIGVLLSMSYWIFTREAKGTFGYVIKVGRLFLMASIGMLYAEDVLWSQSLFVGAWEMVIDKFIKAVLLGQTL